jgi:hypothetical protein
VFTAASKALIGEFNVPGWMLVYSLAEEKGTRTLSRDLADLNTLQKMGLSEAICCICFERRQRLSNGFFPHSIF